MGPTRQQQRAALFESAPWKAELRLTRIPRCPQCGEILKPDTFRVILCWAVCPCCYPAKVPSRHAPCDAHTSTVLALMCRMPADELSHQTVAWHGVYFWTPRKDLPNSLCQQTPCIRSKNDPIAFCR